MKRFIGSLLIAGTPILALLAGDELKIYPAAEVEFATVIGGTYQLQASSNMVQWDNCEAPIAGDGTTVTRLYSTRVTHYRFFRVLVDLPPAGALTNYSDCKGWDVAPLGGAYDASTDQECLQFSWDSYGSLLLKHINAGFNCCPDKLLGSVEIQDGTITITENETGGLCNCDCLFDLDYEISHLKPGVYTLQVVPTYYVPAGDAPLSFVVDLTAPSNGIYCVKRSGYPWHTPTPAGDLIAYSTCKFAGVWSGLAFNTDPPGSNEDCLEYQFEASTGHLLLAHINAAFNCCPTNIQGLVTITDSLLDIVESESGGDCRCECLYDLNYAIYNLVPDTYVISVSEPLLPKGDPALTVTLDLVSNQVGRICLPRSAYPWGQ